MAVIATSDQTFLVLCAGNLALVAVSTMAMAGSQAEQVG